METQLDSRSAVDDVVILTTSDIVVTRAGDYLILPRSAKKAVIACIA